MGPKTNVLAEVGKQELHIIREFDLPLELLFRAYTEPALIEQWMETKVLKLDNKKHGCWQFETTDAAGNKHSFNGVIHEFVPNRKITRTFEMEHAPASAAQSPVQLEFLAFEPLTDHTSRFTMHIVFRSVSDRDRLLQLPFAQGLTTAHNRLQNVVNRLQS